MLESRLARFGDCEDATAVWAKMGVEQPERVPDLPADAFQALVARIEREQDA